MYCSNNRSIFDGFQSVLLNYTTVANRTSHYVHQQTNAKSSLLAYAILSYFTNPTHAFMATGPKLADSYVVFRQLAGCRSQPVRATNLE